jgi:cyclin-dependent kinase 10
MKLPNLSSKSFVEIPDSFAGICSLVSDYQKLNRVGEGTYGIVYRALRNNKIVALKRIRMDNDDEGFPISALREISILKSLNHENIVSVQEICVGDGLENVFMVMEYCEQDMAYLMDNVMSKYPEKAYKVAEVKCLMTQLLKGVAYLHDKDIIHRDLKLSNILLTSKGILKIADFGLARTVDDPMTPRVVTLWYRAPEVLFGDTHYTKAIDMWSVGCIFGEFLLSTPLLPGKNEPQQILLICRLLGSPNTRIWPEMRTLPLYETVKLPSIEYDSVKTTFSKSGLKAQNLLQDMLIYSSKARITAKEAMDNGYFRENPRACSPIFLPTFPELRNERKEAGDGSLDDCGFENFDQVVKKPKME